MKKINIKKEFTEARTSWRWFSRKLYNDHALNLGPGDWRTLTMQMCLEILKELQYMNDRSINVRG